jgi:anti-anti-sigma factor
MATAAAGNERPEMTNASEAVGEGRAPCALCGAAPAEAEADAAQSAACASCGLGGWFVWEDLGDVQLIRLNGSLLGQEPVERLAESLASRRGLTLVLDFAAVQVPSSRFLSKLIDLQKQVRRAQGTMRLRNLSPTVRDVFRMCRLDQLLEVEN